MSLQCKDLWENTWRWDGKMSACNKDQVIETGCTSCLK